MIAACVLLTMTFPLLKTEGGYLFDLRVPLLTLAIFSEGYVVVILTYLTMVLFRFSLGGAGVMPMLMLQTPLVAFAYCLKQRYIHMTPKARLALTTGVSLTMSVCVCLFSIQHMAESLTADTLYLLAGYVFLHGFTTWVMFFLQGTLQENEAMKQEMSRLEKQEVLGELAASIAHEVRNPLTVIKGFMKLLEGQLVQEKNQQYVKIMIQEVDRAEEIISEYLAYAKPQMERVETFDVNERVLNMIQLMESYANLQNISLHAATTAAPLLISGDRSRFSQALINFVKNSIEAMLDGGVIEVQVRPEGGRAVLRILDQGVGMSREQIERLGDPFYSTKDKGTGLGMMVSYKIIKAMNGTISVSSEPGVGTCFTLALPVSR